MKELTERSEELQYAILRNPTLLGDLAERIAKVLKDRVDLPAGRTYVFLPRVYQRPLFMPEVYMRPFEEINLPYPIPFPGPLDPWLVKLLERQRLVSVEARETEKPDPTPWKELNEQILADPALLGELSTTIAEVMEQHGVKLAANETYAFEAVTLERPIFSTPVAAYQPRMMAGAGLTASGLPQATALIPWWRWWQGVPAPELLAALEQMRVPHPGMG